MPIEIERRFLVCSDEWRATAAPSRRYRQGYLSKTPESSVRVRRSEDGATITVKGPRNGFARHEFEYRIPLPHADFMLRSMCATPIIEKVRHWVQHAGMTWEVDVYCGAASGLVLAEVELKRIDQPFAIPPWVGADVTHDLTYRSAGIMQGLWRREGVRTRPAAARRPGARPVLARPEDRAL